MSDTIRVLVVDDHPLVRQSLKALLAHQPDMSVVATAANGREAVELVQELQPAVVVMDIVMNGGDGLWATEKIEALRGDQDIRIIITSIFLNTALAKEAFERGARGFVPKQTAGTELPRAIRDVYEGKLYLSDAISPTFAMKPS